MSEKPKFGMTRQNTPKGQVETMAPPSQPYTQPLPEYKQPLPMYNQPMYNQPSEGMMASPQRLRRSQHSPSYRRQSMGFDEDEDYEFDYMYDEDMKTPKRFMKGKPSNKGKCRGKSPSMIPWIIYLLIIGLSFFGLLFSKQSMMGNLGLIVLQFIITLAILAIVYYLTIRCQTVAAMVVIVIALIIQLFLVAAAGIWFII